MNKDELREKFTSKTGKASAAYVHGFTLSLYYTIWLEEEVVKLKERIDYLEECLNRSWARSQSENPIIDDNM